MLAWGGLHEANGPRKLRGAHVVFHLSQGVSLCEARAEATDGRSDHFLLRPLMDDMLIYTVSSSHGVGPVRAVP